MSDSVNPVSDSVTRGVVHWGPLVVHWGPWWHSGHNVLVNCVYSSVRPCFFNVISVILFDLADLRFLSHLSNYVKKRLDESEFGCHIWHCLTPFWSSLKRCLFWQFCQFWRFWCFSWKSRQFSSILDILAVLGVKLTWLRTVFYGILLSKLAYNPNLNWQNWSKLAKLTSKQCQKGCQNRYLGRLGPYGDSKAVLTRKFTVLTTIKHQFSQFCRKSQVLTKFHSFAELGVTLTWLRTVNYR